MSPETLLHRMLLLSIVPVKHTLAASLGACEESLLAANASGSNILSLATNLNGPNGTASIDWRHTVKATSSTLNSSGAASVDDLAYEDEFWSRIPTGSAPFTACSILIDINLQDELAVGQQDNGDCSSLFGPAFSLLGFQSLVMTTISSLMQTSLYQGKVIQSQSDGDALCSDLASTLGVEATASFPTPFSPTHQLVNLGLVESNPSDATFNCSVPDSAGLWTQSEQDSLAAGHVLANGTNYPQVLLGITPIFTVFLPPMPLSNASLPADFFAADHPNDPDYFPSGLKCIVPKLARGSVDPDPIAFANGSSAIPTDPETDSTPSDAPIKAGESPMVTILLPSLLVTALVASAIWAFARYRRRRASRKAESSVSMSSAAELACCDEDAKQACVEVVESVDDRRRHELDSWVVPCFELPAQGGPVELEANGKFT